MNIPKWGACNAVAGASNLGLMWMDDRKFKRKFPWFVNKVPTKVYILRKFQMAPKFIRWGQTTQKFLTYLVHKWKLLKITIFPQCSSSSCDSITKMPTAVLSNYTSNQRHNHLSILWAMSPREIMHAWLQRCMTQKQLVEYVYCNRKQIKFIDSMHDAPPQ